MRDTECTWQYFRRDKSWRLGKIHFKILATTWHVLLHSRALPRTVPRTLPWVLLSLARQTACHGVNRLSCQCEIYFTCCVAHLPPLWRRPVAREMLVGGLFPRQLHRTVTPLALGIRGGGHFEILCAKSCKFVVHTAVCHWQRLTKCREYIVTTWASVGRGGAQTFGGGVRVLQLAGLALATGLFWRSILFWMRMRNCGLIAGNNCHNKQHLRRKDVRVRGWPRATNGREGGLCLRRMATL